MSDHHGNDHHGPLKLNLAEQERESAREMIATLLDEAGGLGGSVLARLWRAHAEELRRMCLTDPEPDEDAIVCACGQPARDIGVHGLTVCTRCAIREKFEILDGPGGMSELRPFMDDRYAWLLLSGRVLTVMDAHQLAAAGDLASICGIGPRRRAESEEALRLHADSIAEPPKGGEPS